MTANDPNPAAEPGPVSHPADCSCCAGSRVITPRDVPVFAPDGTLGFRIGTYADFAATLKAKLSSLRLTPASDLDAGVPQPPVNPLAALATREPDDFTIALLDAVSVVADVLTFYQERIASEGYLRTAREFRSVVELGRLVGYRPRPGVSSSVYLAYVLDSKSETTIPAGHATKSVPAPDEPDERAQTFETSDPLAARGTLSRIRPLMTRPQLIDPGDRTPDRVLYFKGTSPGLKRNDPLLFLFDDPTTNHLWRVAAEPAPDFAANITAVRVRPWEDPVAAPKVDGGSLKSSDIVAAARSYRSRPQLAFVRDPQLASDLQRALGPIRKLDGTLPEALLAPLKDVRARIGEKEVEPLDTLVGDLKAGIRQEAVAAALAKYDAVRIAGFGRGDPSTTPLRIMLAREYWAQDDAQRAAYRALADRADTAVARLLDAIELLLPTLSAIAMKLQVPGDVELGTLIALAAQRRDALRAARDQAVDQLDSVVSSVVGDWPELLDVTRRRRDAAREVPVEEGVSPRDLEQARLALLAAPPMGAAELALDLGNQASVAIGQVQELLDSAPSASPNDDEVKRRILVLESAANRLRELRRPADEAGLETLRKRLNEVAGAINGINPRDPSTWPTVRETIRDSLKDGPVPARFAAKLEPLTATGATLTAEAARQLAADLSSDLFVEESASQATSPLVALLTVLRAFPEQAAAADLCDLAVDMLNRQVEPQTAIVSRARGYWNDVLTSIARITCLRRDFGKLTPAARRHLRLALLGPMTNAGLTGQILRFLVGLVTALALSRLIFRLRREALAVQAGGWPRIGPWLQTMLAETERLAQRLTGASVGFAIALEAVKALEDLATNDVDGSLPDGGKPAVTLQSFRELLLADSNRIDDLIGSDLSSSLLKQPVPPPTSTYQLARDLRTLFLGDGETSAQTDPLTRLLVALQPGLKGKLYPSLANSETVRPSSLQRVEALRVSAAPFGATAPLKPVYNAAHEFQGTFTEWPLVGCIAFSAVLRRKTAGAAGFEWFVQLKKAGSSSFETVTSRAPLPIPTADPPLQVDPLVQVSVNDQPSGGTVPEGTVDLIVEAMLNNKPVPDQRVARRIAVSRRPGESGDGVLVVTVDGVDTEVSTNVQKRKVELADGTVELSRSADTVMVAGELVPPLAQGFCRRLDLEAVYDRITPGSHLAVIRQAAAPIITVVETVESLALAAFGIAGKSTRLRLADAWLRPEDQQLSSIRGTTVLAQGDALDLAEEPYDADVQGSEIQLDGVLDGLESGRYLIVEGERTDLPGVRESYGRELVMVVGSRQGVATEPPGEAGGAGTAYSCPKPTPDCATDGKQDPAGTTAAAAPAPATTASRGAGRAHTTVTLEHPLKFSFKRDTVTIYGNVVKATHGETRREVLGSGDASVARQEFPLKQAPLTYRPAPVPGGVAPALELRVNDVLWQAADRLTNLGPADRRYVLKTDANGGTTVQFGDGRHGARPASGRENLRAVYRVGLGRAGNVTAGRITQLMSRPQGVTAVNNPLDATGGADRESVDQARRNVPSGLLALERLVSERDYEDFARSSAGIAKAKAVAVTAGRHRLVHLTVAGLDDVPLDPKGDLIGNLREALRRYGTPGVPVRVVPRRLVLVLIQMRVRIDPDRLWDKVAPDLRAALQTALGFERRALGQPLAPSAVVAIAQRVPGVSYVVLEAFGSVPEVVDDQVQTAKDITRAIQALVGQPAGPIRPIRPAPGPDRVMRPGDLSTLPAAEIAFLSRVDETLVLNPINDPGPSRPLEPVR